MPLLEGFTPTAGDVFEIITTAGGILGTFASEILPPLAGDLFWSIDCGANSVTLAVAAPDLPGDFNGDGVVDAADYTVWREGLGDTFDAADYNEWKQFFGATAAPATAVGSSGHTAVPEPASLLLLVIGAAMLVRCRQLPSSLPRRLQDHAAQVHDCCAGL